MLPNNISFPDLFDIFKETANSATPNLTEKVIYEFSEIFLKNTNIERVPVFSGATLNEGIIGYVPNFTNEIINVQNNNTRTFHNGINFYKNKNEGCITIVADGKAGFMIYRDFGKYPLFAMNISCMALFKKDDNEIRKKYPSYNGMLLKWFSVKFFNYLENLVSGEGVSHFTKEIYSKIILEIPSIEEQKEEFKLFKYLFDKRNNLKSLLQDLGRMKGIHLTSKSKINSAFFFKIFNFAKGTHGFTELAVYSNIPEVKEDKIAFWGGDISHIIPKRFVSTHAKNIKGDEVRYFNEKECIILTVDGASAGSMTYKKDMKFTLNHHAGVLTLKEEYAEKVNLEWFAFKYDSLLKSLTVSTGSKTLSNQILEKLSVGYYDDINVQNEEACVYRNLFKLEERILNVAEKIEDLMAKNISY